MRGYRGGRQTTPQWGRKAENWRGDRLSERGLNQSELEQINSGLCAYVLFPSSTAGGKKNTADSRTKQTEHTRAKSAHIYKEAEKKPLLEPGNKGSRDNGGEADKSRRPQETGRITMPAECADQLRNMAKKKKKKKRHRSAESIRMISAPPPLACTLCFQTKPPVCQGPRLQTSVMYMHAFVCLCVC